MEEIKLLDQAGLAVAWERYKEVFTEKDKMKDAVVVNGEVRYPSEGLLYELNTDGESYKVVGMGSCTDINVVVPRTYNGKPIIRIDDYAFKGAQIDSINLWETVTSIGSGAFIECVPFRFVYIYSTTPIDLEVSPFPASNVQGYFVPLHSVDTYKTRWTAYADKIVAIETPESMNAHIVEVANNLMAVDAAQQQIIENLSTVDSNLMQAITNVANNLSTVDSNLIAADTNLQNQINDITGYSQGLEYEVVNVGGTLGFGVKGIGTCTDKDIIIPPTYNGYNVIKLSKKAFQYNFNITRVVLPNTILNIENGALYTSLKSITFSSQTPPTISSGLSNGPNIIEFPAIFLSGVEKIIVPIGSIEEYKNYFILSLPGGETYVDKIVENDNFETLRSDIDDNVTSINNLQTNIEAETTRATEAEDSIRNLVTAEVNRAVEAESNLGHRLEEVETFFKLTEEESLDAALDTLIEIQDYITNEGVAADEMVLDIAANTKAIEDLDAAYKMADTTLQENIDKKANNSEVSALATRIDNLEAEDIELQEQIDDINTELNQHLTLEYDALLNEVTRLQTENLILRTQLDKLWAQVFAPEAVISLEVEKITASTYANGTTFADEEFILLNVYPKTNGTVSITYGDVTKIITDTTGAAEPEAQQVFFGTFNGVSDEIDTPATGVVVISGDYKNFSRGIYNIDDTNIVQADCITAIHNCGNVTAILDWAFVDCNKLTKVVITEGVTSVGSYAFTRCTNLVEVKLANTVTTIGSTVFLGCEKIVDIIIPSSTTVIGPQVFVNCFALRNVIFNNPTGWYVTSDASATSGTAIDVTVPSINSVNITSTYANSYWKRA